ncbi:MAG: phosphatase PAP2 family protein [Dehalococcoidia bacterium]|nr:phosphatase PAP2 family protein [Dehalococcoidia bacterium]
MLEPALFRGRFALITVLIGLVLVCLRTSRDRWTVVREFVFVLGGYLAYSFVRSTTQGGRDVALANARAVERAEQALGVFREPRWQDLVLDHRWLVRLINYEYIYGHWPLIAVVAAALFFRARQQYFLMRSAFFASGAVSLVILALFPVAPPRLVGGGIVDTINTNAHAYTLLQPRAITNQFAAMPSLHFGWDLLAGIAIFRAAPRGLRWLGVLPPVLMAFSIVATGNHYILDVIAGGVVARFGLAVATAAARVPLEQASSVARRQAAQARQAFLSLF